MYDDIWTNIYNFFYYKKFDSVRGEGGHFSVKDLYPGQLMGFLPLFSEMTSRRVFDGPSI